MKTGEIYFGFKLISSEFIKECNSEAMIFEHIKTGARLLKLKNDDDNKVFSIGFRTKPVDSTGVAHIVEHTVLAGSRKYKSKDPFTDLYKGSLQTFLNAMTYPDKTIYPVASRNKKDFWNLVDVYLDAVFYPSIGERKEVFLQEGWRLDYDKEKDKLSYKGIVYNEMRGAMSGADDQVEEFILQALLPDTIYSVNSGGDPYDIPKLTYENFLAFHKKYYHPSNSYIYFYGDGDILEELKYLDENYLSNFDRQDPKSEIEEQELFEEKKYLTYSYSTSDDIEGLNRDFLSYGVIAGDYRNRKDLVMTEILESALVASDASPLRARILEEELAEDIYTMGYANKQIPFAIVLKNSNKKNLEKFESIVDEELGKIVKNGLDKDLVMSTIAKMEYALREADGYPTRGIIYYLEAMKTWLHGASPLKRLKYDRLLSEIKEDLDNGLFEKFIEERILNNKHKAIILVEAKKGLYEEKDRKLEEDLEKLKKSLSKDQLKEIIEENKRLANFQARPETEEEKNTIPKLSLADINNKMKEIPREVIEADGVKLLYHDIFTSGISYFDLVFDSSQFSLEDAKYISLLCKMLGSVDTEKRDYKELSNYTYLVSGGLAISPLAYSCKDDEKKIYPRILVSSKISGQSFKDIFSLIREVIFTSKLDNKKRFKDLVQEMKASMEGSIFQSGQAIVMDRVRSYFSLGAKYGEALSGLDFFYFIQEVDKDIQKGDYSVVERLEEIYKKLFVKDGLIVNLTGDRKGLEALKKDLSLISSDLPEIGSKGHMTFEIEEAKNEGISSSASVQYVSKGASLKEIGYDFKGSMTVLSSILSRDFLYNEIRAKSGAYGAGISINKMSLATYSYRDPALKETIAVYDKMADYLENLEITREELTNYIIGSMSKFDPAMTPSMLGRTDLVRYMQGTDMEELNRNLKEALETSLEEIKAYSTFIRKAMQENYLCTLGSKEKIEECKDVFQEVKNLIRK